MKIWNSTVNEFWPCMEHISNLENWQVRGSYINMEIGRRHRQNFPGRSPDSWTSRACGGLHYAETETRALRKSLQVFSFVFDPITSIPFLQPEICVGGRASITIYVRTSHSPWKSRYSTSKEARANEAPFFLFCSSCLSFKSIMNIPMRCPKCWNISRLGTCMFSCSFSWGFLRLS